MIEKEFLFYASKSKSFIVYLDIFNIFLNISIAFVIDCVYNTIWLSVKLDLVCVWVKGKQRIKTGQKADGRCEK